MKFHRPCSSKTILNPLLLSARSALKRRFPLKKTGPLAKIKPLALLQFFPAALGRYASCFLMGLLLPLTAVTKQELNTKKLMLQQQLSQLREALEADQTTLELFLERRAQHLKQKKQEERALRLELTLKEEEIARLRGELLAAKTQLEQLLLNRQSLKLFLKNFLIAFRSELEVGIPFQKKARLASLNALLLELQDEQMQPSEIFNRFFTFLEDEARMGFSSQVIDTVAALQQGEKRVKMLRIGRIFFALDTQERIMLYAKNPNPAAGAPVYVLLEDLSLSFEQMRNVRLAIDIIQGRRPPALVTLPFSTSLIRPGEKR